MVESAAAPFAKILVPLDGSEAAERILRPVRRLLALPGTEVRAIRVLEPAEIEAARARGEPPFNEAAKGLARVLAPFAEAGMGIRHDLYTGDPATCILADAESYEPSLIAMATHGRDGAERWVRGSVAERVLRRSSFPVFLANPRALDADAPVRRILVPLDGSEMSAAVLPQALAFARLHGAELLLLHVGAADDGTSSLARARHAETLLAPFRERLGGAPVRVLAEKGSPAFGILKAVEDNAVDLVAMTTHGRSGASRFVFGSTAESVLRACRAPLLIVRTSGYRGAKRRLAARAAAPASGRS